jgi:outer membrane lipoprotein-sorting protein
MKTILLSLFLALNAQAITPTDLLKVADRSRGNIGDGITWNAKVETWEDGDHSEREFLVKAKGNDALVEATAPARTRGEKFVFNDRNMWFYKPSLRKPVSISSRQKLSGQAANGDIASTHYARDYDPTFEKTEVINGKKCAVLLLKAKNSQVTYDQIRYWIDEKTKLGIKAEFLTLQGKPFKIGMLEYKNILKTNKGSTPFVSQLTIVDAKFPKNRSVIHYSNPKASELPDSLFNVNNLSR